MLRLGRKGKAAFVGAAALAGATVLVGAGPSATADGPLVVAQEYGTLEVAVANGVTTITLRRPGMAAQTETLSATSKCSMPSDATNNPDLLDFAAAGGSFGLGLNVNDIGVRAKNNCATDSGRASGEETVTVSLGSAIPAGVEITRAELDIEGKKNADLGYALDGGAATSTDLPRAASDNGPDAGIGDNSRVVLDVAAGFRSITLSAAGPAAEISLDGGGDGTYAEFLGDGLVATRGEALGTAATVFVLSSTKSYDGELDCGDTVQARIDPNAIAPVAVSAEVHRREKLDCSAVPYTFVITDQGVLFDTPQDVAADMTIVWQPQAAALPITQRQINLTPDNPATWTNVVWCTAQVSGQWGHPANTPWCLISDTTVLLPNGMVQQTQAYDGAGDPMWR